MLNTCFGKNKTRKKTICGRLTDRFKSESEKHTQKCEKGKANPRLHSCSFEKILS